MPLSATVVKELQGELKQEEIRLHGLQEDRAKLDSQIAMVSEKIRSLRSLLTPATPESPPIPSGDERSKALAGQGFREAIRSLLAAAPEGLRPREVARKLKEGGFQYDGRMDLGVRISSDLWKMEKGGQLEKTKDGKYMLPRGGD